MGRTFKNMEKICLCCGREKKIVNSFFQMCLECNSARLKENKPEKVKEPVNKIKVPKSGLFTAFTGKSKKSESLFTKSKPNKTKGNIDLDEEFYEKCFNLSDHICEECDASLPDVFRDENGKVIARWRYSHIIPKSIAPNLRHFIKNINHLCLICHEKWENGDKSNMKIFAKNLLLFPDYLSKWLTN